MFLCYIGLFPKLYWEGSYKQYRVMNVELLGTSLENFCLFDGKCDIPTVLRMVSANTCAL
jgi:hypothetical protein